MAKNSKDTSGRTIWLTFLGFVLLVLLMAALLRGTDVVLFNPKGWIAEQQLSLMVVSTLIMLGFAAIVLFFLYFFAWKYRETNDKPARNPKAGNGKLLLTTAWVSPLVIAIILSAILLPATQKLAPQRAIEADNDQLTIRVVAMQWKWLFMYPEQGIATVNYAQIPVDTPVRFELTADEVPKSSFWIPHLGGMLYAMTEHVNPLHLMADTTGTYPGRPAEINGIGFAGMNFETHVTEQADFDEWVSAVRNSPTHLDSAEYQKLLEPTENHPTTVYSNLNLNLFNDILSKYEGNHKHFYDDTGREGHGH